MGKIRVLVVDDHELFRRGVKALIAGEPDIEVAGEAGDGEEAIRRARELMPDVILMDVQMPVCDGLAATRAIKAEIPYVRIVMLTVSEAEQNLFEAVKAGAQGYLLKNVASRDVIEAIRRAHRGEATLPGSLAAKILAEFARGGPRHEKPVEQLGERELEVLRELSRGASNREIAAKLFISENTVRNHVKNILAKLHLNNRVQAATWAIREGLAAPPEEDGG